MLNALILQDKYYWQHFIMCEIQLDYKVFNVINKVAHILRNLQQLKGGGLDFLVNIS